MSKYSPKINLSYKYSAYIVFNLINKIWVCCTINGDKIAASIFCTFLVWGWARKQCLIRLAGWQAKTTSYKMTSSSGLHAILVIHADRPFVVVFRVDWVCWLSFVFLFLFWTDAWGAYFLESAFEFAVRVVEENCRLFDWCSDFYVDQTSIL